MSDSSGIPSADDRSRRARRALFAVGFCALAAFIAVFASSLSQSPNLEGFFSGLFGGFFVALFLAVAGAWAAMAFVAAERKKPVELVQAAEIEGSLAPVLRELETARLAVVENVDARIRWMVPLGTIAGLGFWILMQFTDDPADTFDLLFFCGFCAAMAYFLASHNPSEQYRRLYKGRVLPQLAARFGALTYRAAESADIGLLRREEVFPAFNIVTAEDEIAGTYRGLPLSIVELRLQKREGKTTQLVFEGLHVTLDLPRTLRGTTAVISDEGLYGNFRARLRSAAGRERVRLEDPRFEAAYEVYGTDQIAARALLTPAFMERFAALSELPGFGKPLAVARDNKLLILLGKHRLRNLFEPPDFRKPAASREDLIELHHDIEAVLQTADAVIDLDQAARSVARTSGPAPQ